MENRGRVVVVCGPTASGKSEFADRISCYYSFASSAILVDSMQVYREIPCITNQERRLPARLSSLISVSEDWSVADHSAAVRREILLDAGRNEISTLDAGTGMYLNASILDVPLAPSVLEELRASAREETLTAENPRRASRERELELAGEKRRGSIWDSSLIFDTKILYIRPEIQRLEDSIKKRSRQILVSGLPEAERLLSMISHGERVNHSVLDSIGVKELLQLASGELDARSAEERLNIRTRRLAKRQIRWFDKLSRVLPDKTKVSTLDPVDPVNKDSVKNSMHDIIRSWNL